MDNYFLNANDFTFAPFIPKVGGDSGALQLATSKTEPHIQYIVKSSYPEIACNEFMYHHIAAALGLYTQETKLFVGIRGKKYAAGIRYVPNIQPFIHDEANEESRKTFNEFKMLYVILNEDDSEEFYYDEQKRVFKLDNASSFNFDTFKVNSVLSCKGKEPPPMVWQLLTNGLDYIEYGKYAICLQVMNEHCGKAATDIIYDFIKKFAEFDTTKIEAACIALEKIYPLEITMYYPAFIERRIDACKKFICENDVAQFY